MPLFITFVKPKDHNSKSGSDKLMLNQVFWKENPSWRTLDYVTNHEIEAARTKMTEGA